jgi:ubiquinone/menaquinone biosynthesis C-methylase UbiE
MGLAQRVMEWPFAVRRYERIVRPGLTWLGSGLSRRDEQAWLDEAFAPLSEGPVLDLACGTGSYTRWLAERVDPSRIIGMDISAPMLATARLMAPQLRFQEGSAQELPFEEDTLAAVNCFGALHLFPDPVGALNEVKRCLQPGGRFTCLVVSGGPVRTLGIRPFDVETCPMPRLRTDVHRWMTLFVATC